MGLGHPISPVNKYISRTPLPRKKYLDSHSICITMGSIYSFNAISVPVKTDTGTVKRFGLGATNKLFFLSTCRHAAKQYNTAIALTSLI